MPLIAALGVSAKPAETLAEIDRRDSFMDDAEARKTLFAWYGAAMYAAQLFEVELVILLLSLKKLRDPAIEPNEYDRLDALLSRKTLGTLLRELKKYCKIAPEFESLLNQYRDQRNSLAHEFFYKNSTKMTTRRGVDALTLELQNIEQQLREADLIASKMSENVRTASGIDEQAFQEHVNKQFRTEAFRFEAD